MTRISKIILDIDFDCYKDKEANIMKTNYQLIQKHGLPVAEIIALAIVNAKEYPSKKLIEFLQNNLTAKETKAILSISLHKIDVMSFMTSIMSVQGMTLLNPEE
jgi:hypothetical protein